MGLSDEERRRLEKLEQELAATDPDLARKLQAPSGRSATRTVYGVLTVIAGFTLLVAGIATKLTLIGALGFVVMVAGAHWFFRDLRPQDRFGDQP